MTGPVRSAVFCQSAQQYEALRHARPELLEGAVLVGLSSLLSPGRAAERDGHEFIPYTDFLTAEQFLAAARDAQAASREWFPAPAGTAPAPDTQRLVEAVRLEALQPLHDILLAQRVISGALESLRPARVVAAPGLDEKASAVLEYEAEMRGIPVVGAGIKPAPDDLPAGRTGARRRSGILARAARLVRSLAQEAHNVRILAGHRLRQLSDRRPVLLAFGAGVDSVNQQRLVPAVEADGHVRALLLRVGETDASMLNRPGEGVFPALHFVPWNAVLRAGHYAADCRRWWQAFQAFQSAYRGDYPFLFSNPRLVPFFSRLFLYLLPHALATRQDAAAWLRQLSPALVLTSNDVSFPVRTLVLEARRQGISTLGLIHSGLNNMYYRDFRSDRMAVWGEVHVRDFERLLGRPRSALVPIGNPQYDSLGAGRPGKTGAPSRRAPRVVVLTAVAQPQMLYYNQREHLRAWRELERLPEYGIHVTIKPHPRFDDYAFYASLQHQLPGWREDTAGISMARDQFLEEVVPECDLVVVPDVPTTGAVEAMILGKPVIYLMCGFEEVDCCTSIAPGCLVVRTVDQIVPVIREVLGSGEKRQALLEKGQSYLDELLGPRDGQATRRLVDLIAATAAAGTLPRDWVAGAGDRS